MTRESLKAYGAAVGMPRLSPVHVRCFLSRVRFFEQLFGTLVGDRKGPVHIEDRDALSATFHIEGVTYETNAKFAERMFRTWRRKQEGRL